MAAGPRRRHHNEAGLKLANPAQNWVESCLVLTTAGSGDGSWHDGKLEAGRCLRIAALLGISSIFNLMTLGFSAANGT